jgi:hypothetical protein
MPVNKSRAKPNPKQLRHKEKPYTQREITHILMCVVAFSGSIKAARDHLIEEGELESVPRDHTISGWIHGKHSELFVRLRDEAMESMERDLADRYRGVAAQAIEATELGVDVARKHLESGADRDPARSAANLAMVATKTLRDYALLEGKPTAIQENRGLPEAMRALIDMGVLVPHTRALIEGESEEAEPEPDG